MKELQKTYGNSFTIKAIIPKSAEDERLWEQVGKVPGDIRSTGIKALW
nr:hypothetical protein [uncultured Merdimonas sp.]